ncbi:MAG: translation initiation factor IF-2 [Planctomycetota bacterium]|nr:translation initiation factor IF-2 [Planctomycetota bacterium]
MEIERNDVPKLRGLLESAGMFGTPEPDPIPEPVAAPVAKAKEVPTSTVETPPVQDKAEAPKGVPAESKDAAVAESTTSPEAPATEVKTPAVAKTPEKAPKKSTPTTAAKTPARSTTGTARPKTDTARRDTRSGNDSRSGTPTRDRARSTTDSRSPRGGRDTAGTRGRDTRPSTSRPARPAGRGREGAPAADASKTPDRKRIPPKPKTIDRKPATSSSDKSRKNPNTPSVRSTQRTEELGTFNMDRSVQETNHGIVIRRTVPGAMQHSGGRGSSARRRAQTNRERDRWNSQGRRKSRKHGRRSAPPVRPSEVEIRLPITLKELSAATGIKLNQLMTNLMMKHSLMISQNEVVPENMLINISHDFLIDIQVKQEVDLEQSIVEIEQHTQKVDDSKLIVRQPVVTVMGHVDHGKTTLLDYIRNSKSPVAGSEAGGITQHIGAYVAEHNGHKITFIDTPGHAAFTQMRSRGASVTDLVVLVVAADDGVKAQTKEALAHAQAAGVEIVVALNKIDKDNADPEKSLQDLASNGLQPVQWGGQTEVIETSAITGQGVDNLLETILTIAELHEFKANLEGQAYGHVLEAKKTKDRGVAATILVADGTLRIGDDIISGSVTGRVRNLFNDHGQSVESAGPGTPVEILGLNEVPSPGEKFHVFDSSDAKALKSKREMVQFRSENTGIDHTTTEDLFGRLEETKTKKIPIILRCDVQGSLEVLKAEIPALSNEEVALEVKQALIGSVTENDVFLAQAQGGLVLAFNVTVDSKANSVAKDHGIEITHFKVIYELIDYLIQRVEDSLEPERREVVLGELIVRQTFKASRIGVVAGCYVDSGIVRRNTMGRVTRDDIVIWEGSIESVKRFKEDVKEVREGFECGVKLKDFNELQLGDTIEVFEVQEIKRTLPRD